MWVLPRLNVLKWDVTGCISTEDRCVKALEILESNNFLGTSYFFQIIDPSTNDVHTAKLENNKNKIICIDSKIQGTIKERELMQEDVNIYEDIQNLLSSCNANLVIDISCFPKRFFFPLVKLALKETKIKNLVITYTNPEEYCKDDLSEDPEPWYPLPLFRPTKFPDEEYEIAIVGTGFMPFSLPKLLKDKHSEIELRLLFPFPPGPPNYQRSWEFVRKIEKHYTLKEDDRIVRVNSLNLSEAFDHICSATKYGSHKAIFAPYGPKPISLAMCIYASLSDSPVYYTQPKYYNPNYSTGSKECFTYCIRVNGVDLFSLEP